MTESTLDFERGIETSLAGRSTDKVISNPEMIEAPTERLGQAETVLGIIENSPGDTDWLVGDLVEDANENGTETDAIIADLAAEVYVIEGHDDIDDTVSALAVAPEGPLGQSLSDLHKVGGEEMLQRVTTEIDRYHSSTIPAHEAAMVLNEASDNVVSVMPEYEEGQEFTVETFDSAKFVREILKKNPEVRDTYERPRPTYEINGRTVIFRNRMENVDISNNGITVVAASTVRPLSIASLDESGQERYRHFMVELDDFNRGHANDNEGNTLSIPNTPLGIVEAAIMLGAKDLTSLKDKLLREDYADPECQEFIDGLLGVTTVGDDGEALERYDTDGFAIMVSSLAGNETARRIVEVKSVGLMRLEEERKHYNKERAKQYIRERQDDGIALPAPLPFEKMFMVHSTSHDLEFDDNGNAVFRPAGQHENTAIVPRASWHVTINSGVFPHAQANDAWGAQNRLVIAPLTEVMQQTPDRLEVLDGVDTWFVVSPGEQVRVPSPTIIEATTGGEELVQRDGNMVRFLLKESYSQEEQTQIALLAGKYGAAPIDSMKGNDTLGAETLKETCLQMVLSEKGLAREDRDRPSTDGHGMASNLLAQRVMATAYNAGLRSGTHFNHVEDKLEKQGFAQVTDNLAQKLLSPHKAGTYTAAAPDYGAAIGARRQALVNGCLPAAPQFVPVKTRDFGLWV